MSFFLKHKREKKKIKLAHERAREELQLQHQREQRNDMLQHERQRENDSREHARNLRKDVFDHEEAMFTIQANTFKEIVAPKMVKRKTGKNTKPNGLLSWFAKGDENDETDEREEVEYPTREYLDDVFRASAAMAPPPTRVKSTDEHQMIGNEDRLMLEYID